MKKFLIVVSAITVLLLVGCKNNQTVITDVPNDTETQKQMEEEIAKKNKELEELANKNKELEEIVFYKLSNSYDFDMFAYISLYNVALIDNSYQERIDRNPYRFESNGKEYVIECKRNIALQVQPFTFYQVTLNGKKVNIPNIGGVGVVDLDPTDNEKEIVLREIDGTFRTSHVYRINENDELKPIMNSDSMQPFMVGGKCIIPLNLLGIWTSTPLGYFVLDHGELKYIDRLLTGEKVLDDEGRLPKEISERVYYSLGATIIKEDKRIEAGESAEESGLYTFRVIGAKINPGKEELLYDVEIMDDAKWVKENDPNFEEIIPKGTIITEVSISTYIE